jgi:hypothetical protein
MKGNNDQVDNLPVEDEEAKRKAKAAEAAKAAEEAAKSGASVADITQITSKNPDLKMETKKNKDGSTSYQVVDKDGKKGICVREPKDQNSKVEINDLNSCTFSKKDENGHNSSLKISESDDKKKVSFEFSKDAKNIGCAQDDKDGKTIVDIGRDKEGKLHVFIDKDKCKQEISITDDNGKVYNYDKKENKFLSADGKREELEVKGGVRNTKEPSKDVKDLAKQAVAGLGDKKPKGGEEVGKDGKSPPNTAVNKDTPQKQNTKG